MRDIKRDTGVQNSLLDSVGEGEGGMIWENGTETCKISYVKRKKKEMDLRDKRGIVKPAKVKSKLHGKWQKEYIFLQYCE